MTDKEFDVLLELSAFSVDKDERAALMQDVEAILGYVSQLPASSPGGLPSEALAEEGGVGACVAIDLRTDEIAVPDAQEIDAVRTAFPAITSEGLLEVQDVFGSKDV